ncbi:MAG: hypothetical protein JGK24_03770 [Microcoleus sp. PH2017_29_MFU_D_A]|jgi:hypothetical protein|uniref:hypothetical protein n=1 Tax=unclassified Microcoleus TaxID=2642155 RepID=UPI001D84C527|nr:MULTISPECIES: hypothetical protein [unclassified Microcoleus]MCC3416704.1 hypothetical protein [Microcoleus sp. PH2017_07_MST_O_A]MCC3431033.1 hypothetical protein [Microcoleus sp. PH2017_04_SCI_O_A]MCC3441056.1 hypothetical protein [Microcoleus sp. PH2017_03_ELD_O_A]MCC3465718.1 hypothetical protein [Microcoleus sp. PH2017_06_SFM_O_A]MCC3505617.1 hypothetical protein [Microcoleus sp. PH2017_19_SFW_U_A]MCC3508182.1 hypothetical protein [Microcoleus sp. PH2017_17_BER_D_A]TAE09675.1 MAG: hy
MFDNYNPQDGLLYAKHSLTPIFSALEELNPAWAECIRSLLDDKDETIQEQRQEIDDLKYELDCQPNPWDNDGSSHADCHDREYVTDRLGI